MSKTVLIANPKTGRYASQRKPSIETIRDSLNSAGVEAEVLTTSGPGDASTIAARAAKEGAKLVVVAGGDGTINEALQGLIGTETRLAIVPRGTANVAARELKLPLDLRGAVDVIARGKSRRIHVGVAIDESTNNRRYFMLMAGIGLDAAVVRDVNPRLKKRLGKGAFWFTGLSRLANWHPVPFRVEVNGAGYEATFVNVGNAASYGGDLGITPRARLDRPEFEVCIIQTTSRVRYLLLLSDAMKREGLTPNQKGVCFVHATEVRATGAAPVQADGEIIGQLPMRFEIAPHSIEVIVP